MKWDAWSHGWYLLGVAVSVWGVLRHPDGAYAGQYRRGAIRYTDGVA